ncbi:MAG: lipoprotein [Cellvibrio sp.]|nr:lipoprotein [Cellvibrio sp.]
MRKSAIVLVLFLMLCGALTACGQKGPLYLPGPDTPKEKQK